MIMTKGNPEDGEEIIEGIPLDQKFKCPTPFPILWDTGLHCLITPLPQRVDL
jgi:hypothetical protein